jgi:hypothetical protein
MAPLLVVRRITVYSLRLGSANPSLPVLETPPKVKSALAGLRELRGVRSTAIVDGATEVRAHSLIDGPQSPLGVIHQVGKTFQLDTSSLGNWMTIENKQQCALWCSFLAIKNTAISRSDARVLPNGAQLGHTHLSPQKIRQRSPLAEIHFQHPHLSLHREAQTLPPLENRPVALRRSR